MSQKAGRLRKSVAFPFFIQMKKNVAGFRELLYIIFIYRVYLVFIQIEENVVRFRYLYSICFFKNDSK